MHLPTVLSIIRPVAGAPRHSTALSEGEVEPVGCVTSVHTFTTISLSPPSLHISEKAVLPPGVRHVPSQ